MSLKGKKTKFYDYEKTSGRINIPAAISEMLEWKHNDEIFMDTATINGQRGLFLYKKEGETKK